MRIYKMKIYKLAGEDANPITEIPVKATPDEISQLNEANFPDKQKALNNTTEILQMKDELKAKINALNTEYGLNLDINIEDAIYNKLQNMNDFKNIQREPGAANIKNLEDQTNVNRIEQGMMAALNNQAPSPAPKK